MISKKNTDELNANEAFVQMVLQEQADENNMPLPVSFYDLLKLIKIRWGERLSFNEIVEALYGLKAKGWVKETSFYQSNIYWVEEEDN